MSMIDPGKLPLGQILEEAHRRERESEARAELMAEARAEGKNRTGSARGVGGALRRIRGAITRRRSLEG